MIKGDQAAAWNATCGSTFMMLLPELGLEKQSLGCTRIMTVMHELPLSMSVFEGLASHHRSSHQTSVSGSSLFSLLAFCDIDKSGKDVSRVTLTCARLNTILRWGARRIFWNWMAILFPSFATGRLGRHESLHERRAMCLFLRWWHTEVLLSIDGNASGSIIQWNSIPQYDFNVCDRLLVLGQRNDYGDGFSQPFRIVRCVSSIWDSRGNVGHGSSSNQRQHM